MQTKIGRLEMENIQNQCLYLMLVELWKSMAVELFVFDYKGA